MSLPSTRYTVIDWACSASTTLEAVSSITDATSSLLGAGLEMILISRERRRALAMEGAAILGRRGDCHPPAVLAMRNVRCGPPEGLAQEGLSHRRGGPGGRPPRPGAPAPPFPSLP